MVTPEFEPEDAGVGGVNEAEPNALAAPHAEGLANAAVDGDRVADPAVMGHVHHVAEVIADLGVGQQAPVVQHPGDVAVDPDRLALTVTQHTGRATCREEVWQSVLVTGVAVTLKKNKTTK